MVQASSSPPIGAWTRVKAFFGNIGAHVRRLRQHLADPDVKLSYFDEVLAVEHHAINERRRLRPDARHHDQSRRPISKLEPGDAQEPGDHKRPSSGTLPRPATTPATGVNPAALDPQRMRARPIPCSAVGVALSGGGIRSAAFSLGALQALDFHHVILHTDYLSTVSGGGYIGACVTASMSQGAGEFPFGTSDVRDNDAIGHLRNYSNYLLPRAHGQVRNLLEVAAVLMRGLIANGILICTYLLAAALITLAAYPRWQDLPSGNFLPKILLAVEVLLKSLALWIIGLVSTRLQAFLDDWLVKIGSLAGDWFASVGASSGLSDVYARIAAHVPALLFPFLVTALLAAVVAVTLVFWAIVRSESGSTGNDIDSKYLVVARSLLGLTVLSAFLDLQPPIIYWLGSNWQSFHFTSFVSLPILGGAGTVALFAQRLGAFLETTQLSPSVIVRTLRILTRIALVAAGLVLPIVMLVAYWYLTACLYKESGVPQLVDPATTPWLDQRLLLVFIPIVWLFEANAYSLHQFYKDRLSKAFLFTPSFTGLADPPTLLNFKLSHIHPTLSPYHIINAALNVQGSKEANRRGRNADFFTFTRDFVGSDLTHFAATATHPTTIGMETIDPRLDLGSAMAISGAALSANMGSNTVRWLSPTLALLNIRLGYWLRNPRDLGNKISFLKLREWYYALLGKFYLILEMSNALDEERAFVYLTDGGHIENLGIYQLLKRGCRLIIAIDAEADPEISCASLLKLERYARIDLGVRIILPWEKIAARNREINRDINPRTPQEAKRHHGPHCAMGPILYDDGSRGILLYFKSSLSGDEKDYVLDYKKRNRDFPHENTGDQFFTEEQFEAYRSLGYHVVEGYFSGVDAISWLEDGHGAWTSVDEAKAEVCHALGWNP
jgi:predicted acylesterase/phospholipase RssA